jgi:hypothetical protein
MVTSEKTKSNGSGKTKKSAKSEYQPPKRLSKLGQWMLDHPGGIGVVIDRRAVNK